MLDIHVPILIRAAVVPMNCAAAMAGGLHPVPPSIAKPILSVIVIPIPVDRTDHPTVSKAA